MSGPYVRGIENDLVKIPPRRYKSAIDKIMKNIIVDEKGCWRWQRWITRLGYGVVRVHKLSVMAHRYSYAAFRGIPPDAFLDHRCRVRCCVNPDHLECVTNAENWKRGKAPSNLNRLKTSCNNGHPFDENNTIVRPSGRRDCRKCLQQRQRKNYYANLERSRKRRRDYWRTAKEAKP